MITIIHNANERGHADHGWLNSYHSFSFAGYRDPEKIHFGALRVLNDDTVAPGMGFGEHPHDNMEIISIILKGSLEHKDSMGNSSVIRAGEVQVMSAGTGITHSEFNPSKTEEVQFLQIWIFAKEKDIEPRYKQKTFDSSFRKNRLDFIAAPVDLDEAMLINQDAYIALGRYNRGINAIYKLKQKGNGVYVFVISGKITVAGKSLGERDAMGIWETDKISFIPATESEILLIEVPMI
jgi:redox-sensitive bicupin YhaK (pirin superfamily)